VTLVLKEYINTLGSMLKKSYQLMHKKCGGAILVSRTGKSGSIGFFCSVCGEMWETPNEIKAHLSWRNTTEKDKRYKPTY